ncbi:MAG TPA: hypothetical protein ACFCUY_17835 [Xenococcaceae cyanobacterium]
MHNFDCIAHDPEQLITLEITEAQILGKDRSDRIKYPRFLNHRVSGNHRNYGAIFHSNVVMPKTCSVTNVNSLEDTLSIL